VWHCFGEARSPIEILILIAISHRLGRVAVELGLRRISSTLEDALLALSRCQRSGEISRLRYCSERRQRGSGDHAAA
jgi:hypothetical protein